MTSCFSMKGQTVHMKKISFFIMLCIILTMLIPNNTAKAISFSPELDIYSNGVYMENLDTGDLVYLKNEDKKTYPASLTKIMTAIILLDNFKDDLDALKTTKAIVPKEVLDELAGQDPSHVDLKIGEEVTYIDLFYALMLPSACDAAGVIAYDICDGNTAQFIQKMNDKAKELGCNNTNFVNAHGLFDKNQVTTPEDMATIIKYAMTYPLFMEVCNTPKYTMAATNMHMVPRPIAHTNKLLIPDNNYYYKYAIGIKTGRIDEVGRNLASIAEKDGTRYLIVTIGAPEKREANELIRTECLDHINLYEWAFNSLHTKKLLETKADIGKQEVNFGENASFVLVKPAEEFSTLCMDGLEIKPRMVIDSIPSAPVRIGDVIGKVEVVYNGDVLFTTDAIAGSDVKRDNISYYLKFAEEFVLSNLILVIVCYFVFVTILHIIIFSKKRSRKKKSRNYT